MIVIYTERDLSEAGKKKSFEDIGLYDFSRCYPNQSQVVEEARLVLYATQPGAVKVLKANNQELGTFERNSDQFLSAITIAT